MTVSFQMTAEAVLRLVNDPVLPFYPLDIALDVQNKLKGDSRTPPALLAAASSLRDSATFLQSEAMRPANDPKEREPAHVRMLNDVLRDLEKSFLSPQPPPGVYRNLLYSLPGAGPRFSILRFAMETPGPSSNQAVDQAVNQSLSHITSSIIYAQRLISSGLDLFENNPDDTI
ncbi:inactive N-acetylated-alpha-linked acidic dipeptidase-like protein 2 [Hypomesus transpacificus]|uniref:inactive N-acetylated-alpha-linked acidic dipeptidase-like protein 2 n=1 Tax=Hypomesus transpacificus TaxID=137520 RepID=UPI001F07CF1F|nr:inactive N-acetylated-alpha-linked acidic dipeptidase-like protein 2 [Hypomesus transpacificus]